ncbi:MAG: hypothetical protein K6E91_09710 [Butyrivibrio sp.]|nr:hypothetical protein [Butyrivibrio sp.]
MENNTGRNTELRDDDMMAASGGKKIIAGLDEKQVVEVAERVLEMSGVSPNIKKIAGNIKHPDNTDSTT